MVFRWTQASGSRSTTATCCHGTRRPTGSARGAGGRPRGRALTARSNSRRVTSWTGWPISCRHRGSTGIACRLETSQGCSPRITSSGRPSRPMTKGNVGQPRDAATDGHAVGGHAARGDTTGDCCDLRHKLRSHDTKGQTHGPSGRGVSFCVPGVWWRHPTQRRRPAGAGSLQTGGSQAGEGQDGFARIKSDTGASRRTARTTARLAGPWPADRLGRARAGPRRPGNLSGTDRRAARHRYPQPLTAFHATVRTARKKSGFKTGLEPTRKIRP